MTVVSLLWRWIHKRHRFTQVHLKMHDVLWYYSWRTEVSTAISAWLLSSLDMNNEPTSGGDVLYTAPASNPWSLLTTILSSTLWSFCINQIKLRLEIHAYKIFIHLNQLFNFTGYNRKAHVSYFKTFKSRYSFIFLQIKVKIYCFVNSSNNRTSWRS